MEKSTQLLLTEQITHFHSLPEHFSDFFNFQAVHQTYMFDNLVNGALIGRFDEQLL
jgi:hypothetical protein